MRLFYLFVKFLIDSTLTAQNARVDKRWLQQQDSARQAEIAGEKTQRRLWSGTGNQRAPDATEFPERFFPFPHRGGQMKRDRLSCLLDLEIGSDLTQG